MPQIKENFFENILFRFESCSCDCVEDIEHVAPGEEPISKFKLQAMPEHPILFGYAAKDGLVRIAPNGTIEERNILGTLMSLANKPTKELVSSNEIIFSQCERKKRLIPNNINSCWNDVTDLLLVEHLHSGASYIYNTPFSIRNIEIKMQKLSLFTDIFYIIFS